MRNSLKAMGEVYWMPPKTGERTSNIDCIVYWLTAKNIQAHCFIAFVWLRYGAECYSAYYP